MNPYLVPSKDIFYPDSDGLPMSDNSKQLRWIVTLFSNLESQFGEREDVFVSANQLWYPVEGEPTIRAAPDVYVVFGRPKGDRGSYRQWEEDDIPMTVVFEILSPGNSQQELIEKFAFYEDYGVEEYYIYDPDSNLLQGFRRQGDSLLRIRPIQDYVSPRLGICFDLSGEELVVRHPDGRPFLPPWQREEDLKRERDDAKLLAERAQRERDDAKLLAERVQRERDEAEQRAEHMRKQAARLRELSRKALRQQASPEELQELDQLLKENGA